MRNRKRTLSDKASWNFKYDRQASQLSIGPWRSVQYRQDLVTEFLVLHLRYVPPCAGIAGEGRGDPGHTCREGTAGSEFGLSLLLRSAPSASFSSEGSWPGSRREGRAVSEGLRGWFGVPSPGSCRPKELDKDGWVQPPCNVHGRKTGCRCADIKKLTKQEALSGFA